MNAHALGVLEFPSVLEVVAGHATSALGAARVREAAPSLDRAWLEGEHARVEAVRAIIVGEGGEGWRPEPVPDAAAPLARLRAGGAVWTGAELLDGALLLRSARLTRERLTEGTSATGTTALLPLARALLSARPAESAVERALDSEGVVKDDASSELRRLRRALRGAGADLVRMLERTLARLEPHHRVSDMSVTVRNGRYVVPIRREARGVVGGLVHDASATGATLFVEPPAAVEAGNRIRELEVAEAREVERVLTELTGLFRPMRDALLASLDALIELDSLYARARFAEEFQCAPAEFADDGDGFVVVNGRHPLLLAQKRAVVPFDLEMGPGERTLLLSGPNTGGKTVLLRAIGLMSALAQSGIPAPVGAGSRLAFLDDCFADIGDEQSIEASLSTFSAHVRTLGEILAHATPRSLVLIDELGSGTDPSEGAALGGAVLEALTARGALTVATTHLGALKLLATEVPGLVNGSLQFDEAALEPTFRLRKGLPGRSYGLAIARRLQLPAAVLQRAEERLPHGERDVAGLLAGLEEREAELEQRLARATAEADRQRNARERLEEREEQLRAGERALERRARAEAREYLLAARAEVERITQSLREGSRVEDDSRAARRGLEALAAGHAAALSELDRSAERPREVERGDVPSAGDVVRVDALGGRTGTVIALRGDNAVVAVGALKLTVPASTLRHVAQPAATAAVPVAPRVPEPAGRTEVDLRGLRPDEAEAALVAALDDAVRSDIRALRVIHGKGTGALRERVQEVLLADDRVRGARMGAWNDGGAGVTVAELA